MSSAVLVDQKSLTYLLGSLDPKQRLYVEARAHGAMPVAAAHSAGYVDPVSEAMTLEQNFTVRSALEYTLRVKARETQLTREDVLAGFLHAAELASSSIEITAAWREIGKVIGAYAPQKLQINHTHQVTQEQLASMNDEELAELAAIDAEFVELKE